MIRGSFEVAAGLVGLLGKTPLAVHGIYMSIAVVLYVTPLAIALSTANISSALLGAGKAGEACDVICMGLWAVNTSGVCVAALIYFIGPYWARLYSSDREVLSLFEGMLPIFALYLFADYIKCVPVTMLRSTGRPQVTVIGNAIACFALMLPIGWLVTVHLRYGLYGEWLTMGLSWLVVALFFTGILLATNWEDQVEQARLCSARESKIFEIQSNSADL